MKMALEIGKCAGEMPSWDWGRGVDPQMRRQRLDEISAEIAVVSTGVSCC